MALGRLLMFKGSVRVLVACDKYMIFETPYPMLKTCWKRKALEGGSCERLPNSGRE